MAHLVCAKDVARAVEPRPRAIPQLVVRLLGLAEERHLVALCRTVLLCRARVVVRAGSAPCERRRRRGRRQRADDEGRVGFLEACQVPEVAPLPEAVAVGLAGTSRVSLGSTSPASVRESERDSEDVQDVLRRVDGAPSRDDDDCVIVEPVDEFPPAGLVLCCRDAGGELARSEEVRVG